MKKLSLLLMSIVMIFAMISCEKTENPISSVEYDSLLKSVTADGVSVIGIELDGYVPGNAADECAQTECGGLFSAKIEATGEGIDDGEYVVEGENTITILNSGEKVFDWKSEWPVCAVIVKGGNGANVYYMEGATNGSGFIAPEKNGRPAGVSHVTFCYEMPQEEDLVIAVKSYYYEGSLSGNKTWAASTGEYIFTSAGGWCNVTGIQPFESSTFNMHKSYELENIVGTITVSKGVETTITIDLIDTHLIYESLIFIGTQEELENSVTDDGCPDESLWLVREDAGNSVTITL